MSAQPDTNPTVRSVPDLDRVLTTASAQAGFGAEGARLLRHFANAVYLLGDVPVVARIGYGPRLGEGGSCTPCCNRFTNQHQRSDVLPRRSYRPTSLCCSALTRQIVLLEPTYSHFSPGGGVAARTEIRANCLTSLGKGLKPG